MSFAPLLYDADANTYTFTGVDNIIVLLYDPCSDKIAHEAHMKRNQNDIECFLYTEKKMMDRNDRKIFGMQSGANTLFTFCCDTTHNVCSGKVKGSLWWNWMCKGCWPNGHWKKIRGTNVCICINWRTGDESFFPIIWYTTFLHAEYTQFFYWC